MKKFTQFHALYTPLLILVLVSAPAQGKEYVEGLAHWPVLTLQRALELGLTKNLGLRIETINVPIGEEGIIAEDARFDPAVDATTSARTQQTPTSSTLSGDDFALQRTLDKSILQRSYGGEAGLGKKFRSGLDSRLSFRTALESNDSIINGLDPEYRSYLVLDLTQPLLRDFGSTVNTSDLRVAETKLQQASFGVLSSVQRLAADIETVYYEMSQAIQAYTYRIESRDLARQLLAGNQKKLETGLIPISEVQEAETAVASRDELVLSARQQLETVGTRLRDLLGINREDPLSREFFRTQDLPGTGQVFPNFEEALPVALVSRPDLERQRLEIVSRDIRLQFAENQTLPRLDLDATFGLNGLSGDEQRLEFGGSAAGSNPQAGEYFDSMNRLAERDGYEWYAGVRFTYPLGNREAKARYRSRNLEKKQAIYGLKRLETTVETEVINGLTTVNRSLERVRVAGRFESLAETTLSQEMARMEEGLSDTFRILDFQDKVIEARLRKATALTDFNKGLAGLYLAMGINLERLNIAYDAKNPEKNNATN